MRGKLSCTELIARIQCLRLWWRVVVFSLGNAGALQSCIWGHVYGLLCCSMPLQLCSYRRERNLILVQAEQITFPELLCEWTYFPTKILPPCFEKNQQVLLSNKPPATSKPTSKPLTTWRNFSMWKSNLSLRDPRVSLLDLRRSHLAGKSLWLWSLSLGFVSFNAISWGSQVLNCSAHNVKIISWEQIMVNHLWIGNVIKK